MSENVDWTNLAEGREERRAIVNTVMRRSGGTVPLIRNGVGDVCLLHSDNVSLYILWQRGALSSRKHLDDVTAAGRQCAEHGAYQPLCRLSR